MNVGPRPRSYGSLDITKFPGISCQYKLPKCVLSEALEGLNLVTLADVATRRKEGDDWKKSKRAIKGREASVLMVLVFKIFITPSLTIS